jgi:hypothetical protein
MKTFTEFIRNLNESPAAAPVKSVIDYRDGLVDVGNLLITALTKIKFGHPDKPYDLNTLTNIEDTLRDLTKNVQLFPELRSIVKSKVKFPKRPKRAQRPGP